MSKEKGGIKEKRIGGDRKKDGGRDERQGGSTWR